MVGVLLLIDSTTVDRDTCKLSNNADNLAGELQWIEEEALYHRSAYDLQQRRISSNCQRGKKEEEEKMGVSQRHSI